VSTSKAGPEVWRGERQATGRTPAGSKTPPPPTSRPAGLVAGIEHQQVERDRLLSLCRQLRAQHRCPERCVFTGELRRGGLAAFDELGR